MASGGMGLAPFLWGEGGQRLSADEVARRRALASSLIPQQAPRDYWSGINSIVGNIGGALHNWQADQAETAGRSEYEGLLAQALESGATDIASLAPLLTHDFASSGGSALGQALLNQTISQSDPIYQQNLERGNLELEALRNPAPPAPDYGFTFAPDGTLIRTETTSGTFDPVGQFSRPSEMSFESVTLQLPDGTQRTLNTGDPSQMQEANSLISQGALEIPASLVTVNTGEQAPQVGTIPPSMALVEDPDHPSGYRMETIGGSPGEAEALAAAQQEEQRRRQASTQGATVVQDAGIAIQGIDSLSGISADPGPVGANIRKANAGIAGTEEYRIQQFVDSAISNVGFDQLNQMRQSSPTGGALGNVTEQQLRQLQSVLGRYDPGLPIEDQKFILQRISNIYSDITFGSRQEREAAVEQGRMDRDQADYYDQFYYPETRDAGGASIEQTTEDNWIDLGDGVRIREIQ